MYYSLSCYKIYKNWKIQRGRKRTTSLNYPKNYNIEKKTLKTILKTPQNSSWLLFLCSRNPKVFIGEKGHHSTYTEPRVKSRCVAPRHCRKNAAIAVFSQQFYSGAAYCTLSPYRLYFLESEFGPPVLTKPPSKFNGYSRRLLITN